MNTPVAPYPGMPDNSFTKPLWDEIRKNRTEEQKQLEKLAPKKTGTLKNTIPKDFNGVFVVKTDFKYKKDVEDD